MRPINRILSGYKLLGLVDKNYKPKLIGSIMYYEGYPKDHHILSLITWNNSKNTDFFILTTSKYFSKWCEFSKRFSNIRVIVTDNIEDLMLKYNLISKESNKILKLSKPKKKICGLKPFYKIIFDHVLCDYELWAWHDHDVLVSNITPINNLLKNKKEIVFFRRHCGQFCIFKNNVTNIEYANKMLNNFIKTTKSTYYYDEDIFQSGVLEKNAFIDEENRCYNIMGRGRSPDRGCFSSISYNGIDILLDKNKRFFISISHLYKNKIKMTSQYEKFNINPDFLITEFI